MRLTSVAGHNTAGRGLAIAALLGAAQFCDAHFGVTIAVIHVGVAAGVVKHIQLAKRVAGGLFALGVEQGAGLLKVVIARLVAARGDAASAVPAIDKVFVGGGGAGLLKRQAGVSGRGAGQADVVGHD